VPSIPHCSDPCLTLASATHDNQPRSPRCSCAKMVVLAAWPLHHRRRYPWWLWTLAYVRV
jgi:hypothetical protein